MSSLFIVATDPGRVLFATLQQITPAGTLGNLWNVTTGVWAPSVGINDRKIPLTEGSLNDIGSYTGGVGTLGTYSGFVVKKIHDQNDGNRVIGMDVVYLLNGVEQRYSIASDITGLPALVRAELNSNPVPASNMRGTDNALLAASYVAPNNASIVSAEASAATAATQATTAATQATTAATQATTLTTNYTPARAAKLDMLDVAVSTRSTLTAPQVRSELNSNPVPASNMRGTDNALLASAYVAPANATITTAAADALAAKTSAQTIEARLTASRAGYLDNLSAGAVAQQSTVAAISNTVRVKLVTPPDAEVPSTSANVYAIDLLLYDNNGNMEAADGLPTFVATNSSGTDRSTNIGTVNTISPGHYRTTYNVTSSHPLESITIVASVVENGQTIKAVGSFNIGAEGTVSGGTGAFTAADRTKLEAVFNKLPTKPYITGTAAADGDINLDQCDGSREPFKADVSLLATAASIAALPTNVRTFLNSNPVPASNMRGTDNALLASAYVAPDNASAATAATQATLAATQATLAANEAGTAKTAAQSVDGKLTISRAAKLDNLDAVISSRASVTTLDLVKAKTDLITSAIATESSVLAVKAKTDLLPAQPAAVGNIPTSSQIAVAVDSVLTTSHPGNWASGGDATQAKQDAILAAIATINPGPVSTVQVVSAARTWRIMESGEDVLAPNVLVAPAGSTWVLAMDFSRLLNAGTGITNVTSVLDVSGNGLVPTGLVTSQDRAKAHFTVAGLAAGKTYELKVTVSTSDGQTLVGRGRLRVE